MVPHSLNELNKNGTQNQQLSMLSWNTNGLFSPHGRREATKQALQELIPHFDVIALQDIRVGDPGGVKHFPPRNTFSIWSTVPQGRSSHLPPAGGVGLIFPGVLRSLVKDKFTDTRKLGRYVGGSLLYTPSPLAIFSVYFPHVGSSLSGNTGRQRRLIRR